MHFVERLAGELRILCGIDKPPAELEKIYRETFARWEYRKDNIKDVRRLKPGSLAENHILVHNDEAFSFWGNIADFAITVAYMVNGDFIQYRLHGSDQLRYAAHYKGWVCEAGVARPYPLWKLHQRAVIYHKFPARNREVAEMLGYVLMVRV